MDVDGKGHVALDDYRRIVRDLFWASSAAPASACRRSRVPLSAAAAGASRRASVAAHLGGGAGADVRRKALALRRPAAAGGNRRAFYGHARWELSAS